jgi:hypothetical protein
MTTTTAPLWRRFLCRSRLWHDWRNFSNPDGGRYRACSVCGRDQPRGNIPVI